MLSNKTGVALSGGRSQNQGRITNNTDGRKVGVNSPTGKIANKSMISTANTQGARKPVNDYDQEWNQNQYQTQGQKGGRYDNLRANKSEILDKAWNDRQLAG